MSEFASSARGRYFQIRHDGMVRAVTEESFNQAKEMADMHPSNEPGADAAAQIEMPKYQCHKKVWALKIGSVQPVVGGAAIITPADTRYAPFKVDQDYVGRHGPTAGGYYVVYDGDGYKSFSPAKAFEEGYTLIE